MKITKPVSNLHTHTDFSDGRGSAEDQINSALRCGFVSLGISDHSHAHYDDASMKAGREEEYAETVRRLGACYADRLDIFTGLELDSFSTCRTELYDYIIGSVHAVKAGNEYLPVDFSAERQKNIIDTYFNGIETAFSQAYYSELIRHVTECRPDIVGHFDLITKYDTIDEESLEYRTIALDALREIMKTCTRFEVNTGGMARGYKSSPYPARFILEEILRLGGTVTVSSDCHDPDKLDYAFEETLRMLGELGFTHIDRFTRDGFVADEIVL